MTREVKIEGQGDLVLTFDIKETGGVYELGESDLNKAVTLTGDNECGAGADGKVLLGQFVSVSADGKAAGIKVRGILQGIPYDADGTVPLLGDSVQFSAANEVDKGVDVNIARGLVISKDTTAETVNILM